jgi:hypothetical protein
LLRRSRRLSRSRKAHVVIGAESKGSYTFRLSVLVCSYELWSANVVSWFPGVLSTRIPLPSNSVLFCLPSAIKSFSKDLLYFPFGFAIYQIWWWFCEVRTMFGRLLVRRKVRSMEDVVDLPRSWQSELVSHMAEGFGHPERAISL